jgi:hypothetical protein
VAAEFLRFVYDRASLEATEELLKIPGLLDDIAKAEKDVAEGRGLNRREVRPDIRCSAGAAGAEVS